MNNSVRRLTDGAMMCAIVGVLLLINRQFAGMFEEMFLFIFPLPMVFYSVKYGMRQSWLVLAAMGLLSFIIGTPQTVFYIISEGLIGLIYGSGIHSKKNTHRLVLITMVCGAIVNVLSTVVYAAFFGYDLTAEISEMETIMTDVFSQYGVSVPSTINLSQYILTIFVVSAILTGVLQGLVTHLLSQLMLRRMRFPVEKAPPLSEYFPPKWSGYLGMLGFACYYYSILKPLSNDVAQNIFQGLGMCGYLYLAVYGLVAIVTWMKVRYHKRGLGFVLGFLAMFMMPLGLVFLGFLFITTDMHQRMLEGGSSNAAKTE